MHGMVNIGYIYGLMNGEETYKITMIFREKGSSDNIVLKIAN